MKKTVSVTSFIPKEIGKGVGYFVIAIVCIVFATVIGYYNWKYEYPH